MEIRPDAAEDTTLRFSRRSAVKKVARIVGLCSKPVQQRYLAATPAEQASLRAVVDREQDWIVQKMRKKGYRLEGRVAGVYGLFTRGPARGTIELEAAAVPLGAGR
jgi:hypothetical protein